MKVSYSLLVLLAAFLAGAPRAEAGTDLGAAAKALSAAAKNNEFDKVREIFGKLGSSGEKKAASIILQTLAAIPAHEAADAAIEALAALGTENIVEAFDDTIKKHKKKPNDGLLSIILAVAEKLDGAQPEAWLVEGLQSGTYLHYRNAIPPLVKRRSKSAIPALIDLLEKVGYDPKTESYLVRDALINLTGKDFANITEWREFWKSNGADFDPKALDQPQGTTGVPRKTAANLEGLKTPSFFEVEVMSDHILFIIDVSGSMKMWDKGDEKIGTGPDWQTRQRLARVKHHLSAAVKNLPKYATFNIIAYSSWQKAFNPKGTVPANEQWKKKALEFIDGLRPEGATHTDEALAEAFKDSSLDTIFLLTDGCPEKETSAAKPRDLMQAILDATRKMNRLPRVKLYAFGFVGDGEYPPGSSPPPPNPKKDADRPTSEELAAFLKKLAEENYGKFTPVK
ncbi:MAG: VWA domain-containing protein [Planctomycetes bacterium]|nr:VWA domain-containing protein [Planctomycetota bacterium]